MMKLSHSMCLVQILGVLVVHSSLVQAQESRAQNPGDENAHAARPKLGLGELSAEVLAHTVVSGFTQVDYLQRDISLDELSDGSGEPLNQDRFLVRHARIRFDTDWRHVGVSAETELFSGEATARPVAFDLHGQLPPAKNSDAPLVRARVGLFPVPFGFENHDQSDHKRFFGERSLFSHGFVPGRFDLGASLSGHLWALDWVVAAQNGEPLGVATFAYDDPNAAKDIAGRLRVRGELFPGIRAAAATSMIYGRGFSPGTPPTKDSFEWRDLNEDGRVLPSELIPIPGAAGRESKNFDRWGLGADMQVWSTVPRLGELMVYGEVALGVNLDRAIAPADPVLIGRDQRGIGFYIAATQEVTRHATIGVRFEQYEPNIDSLQPFAGRTVVSRRRFRTLSSGVSTQMALSKTARARLLAEYELQRNSLGRDNQGLPAHLDNDTLRLRVELVF